MAEGVNGREYRIQLTKWAEGFDHIMDALARQTCQEISEGVVRDTPVDTGFLSTSWQPSIGQPLAGEGNGGTSMQVSAIAASVVAGDIYWMTNNAAYARRIEYGFVGTDSLGRTYNQKGRFFVRKNIRRARYIVEKLVGELSK